jgi:hypothetical protein
MWLPEPGLEQVGRNLSAYFLAIMVGGGLRMLWEIFKNWKNKRG